MDVDIQTIISMDEEATGKALDNFLEAASTLFAFPELDINNSRFDLWNALYQLSSSSNDHKVLIKCFSAIRLLSREKASLSKLVTNDWLDLFKKHAGLCDVNNYAFDKETEAVAIEAEKCLCNIVFNSLAAAAQCYKNGILEAIIQRIKFYKDPLFPEEIKFFDVKLLFIITAVRPETRKRIKTEMHGVKYLIEILENILSESLQNMSHNSDMPDIYLTETQVNLACEVLKALFNVTLHADENDEEEVRCYTHLVGILRKYLLIPTTSIEKRWMLQNNVINILTNMPFKSYHNLIETVTDTEKVPKKFLFEDKNMTALYEVLLFLKTKFAKEPTVSNQHEILSPVITVLLKCATSERQMRKYLKLQVLPPLKDVHNRPEQGDELRNKLCRLLTTPITQLRDLVAEFLFILCKKNVTKMIKYTGYGNAAGLFAQRGLLGGKHDEGESEFSSDDGDSETEEYAEFKHGINPVVGCYEAPHPKPMENMTEEQKEYEAMKLVQLIDDLSKCGTIKPCRVGKDGKPEPIEHVLQLQEGLKFQQNDESDSE